MHTSFMAFSFSLTSPITIAAHSWAFVFRLSLSVISSLHLCCALQVLFQHIARSARPMAIDQLLATGGCGSSPAGALGR